VLRSGNAERLDEHKLLVTCDREEYSNSAKESMHSDFTKPDAAYFSAAITAEKYAA